MGKKYIHSTYSLVLKVRIGRHQMTPGIDWYCRYGKCYCVAHNPYFESQISFRIRSVHSASMLNQTLIHSCGTWYIWWSTICPPNGNLEILDKEIFVDIETEKFTFFLLSSRHPTLQNVRIIIDHSCWMKWNHLVGLNTVSLYKDEPLNQNENLYYDKRNYFNSCVDYIARFC